MDQHRNQKIFFGEIIFIIACVLSLVGFGVYKLVQNFSRPTLLEIAIAPSNATVKINGETYKNGVYEFEEGSYTAEISADGFSSKIIDLSVKNRETTLFIDYLEPTNGDLYSLFDDGENATILKQIKDSEISELTEKYDKIMAIKTELPINYYFANEGDNPSPSKSVGFANYVVIEDGSNEASCSRSFCLKISGRGANASRAKLVLEKYGYNIDDYEVIYE